MRSPKKRRGKPWTDALSPRLKSAVSQLVGAGAWEEFGCGWWVISFPGFASLPWGAEGTWHVDGAHFKHYPHSREIGLVPVFLFSDIRAGGGGTALLRGSHRRVAEILWRRAGKTGMKGPKLSDMARKVLLPPRSQDVVETVGEAGDVMLTHPLLLHARSTNLAPVEEAGVRFMCHPAIPLKQHMDFKAPPATFSPVQRVVWNAREPLDDMDGRPLPPIYSADECDHQPMNKPMSKPMSKQGQRQRAR